MKTNQIMTRKMGDFEVYQRTQDAMFNASSLIEQWNKHSKTRKSIDEFLRTKPTKAFMEELANEVKINEVDYNRNGLSQEVEEPTLIITVKGKGIKGGGKTPDKVWMHPYLFLKFAMWLNPRFEVQVIKFVYDQLIDLRNDIGDQYKEFSSACSQIGCVTQEDFKIMARCLNCVVLGKDRQSKQRNELTQEEASEMRKVSDFFIHAVDNGFIKDMAEAKAYFRKEYDKKYTKSLPFNK